MMRMNSTCVKLRKNISVGASSVGPELLIKSEDDDCVVTSIGCCELLLDGRLLDGPLGRLGDSVGTMGGDVLGERIVHVSAILGRLCSAEAISWSVAFTASKKYYKHDYCYQSSETVT